METGYIPDGYTRPGFISRVPGLHPELRFTFRPLLCTERAVILTHVEKSGPDKAERIAAETIAKKVSDWDLRHPTSNGIVALTEPEILKTHPVLLSKLFQIVAGNMPSSIDPEWDAESRRQTDEEAYQKALNGDMAVEKSDIKN